MQIYESNLQKENAKFPSQLDFYQIANNRHLLKTKEEKDRYRRLCAGAEGERLVLEYLEKHGEKNWSVLLNFWMDHNGPFETDLMLFTQNQLYCFEIKNYTGDFTYENGVSKVNGWELDNNLVEQTRRASVKMKNILTNFRYPVPVTHAVIFTNADNYVQILSDVGDLKIIPRYCLLNFIKNIAENEKKSTRSPLNIRRILDHFETYEIDNPFAPKPLSGTSMLAVRKGIYCRKCLSYDVEIRRTQIICNCGFNESKEEATLRTICDYGVLNFASKLTIKNLLEFLDNQISAKYLSQILYKHFDVYQNGSHTFFHNIRVPYYKSEQSFKL